MTGVSRSFLTCAGIEAHNIEPCIMAVKVLSLLPRMYYGERNPEIIYDNQRPRRCPNDTGTIIITFSSS